MVARNLRLARSSEGSEIAEAAFILPLVFLFLFAILWFGRAFNTWSTITSAAREGARAASRPTCGSCGPPALSWNGTNLPDDTTVANVVIAVMKTSRVDPAQIIQYVPTSGPQKPLPCPSPPAPVAVQSTLCDVTTDKITVCRFVQLNPNNSPMQCGAMVFFQYPFGSGIPFPSVPTLSYQTVTMTAAGQNLMQY